MDKSQKRMVWFFRIMLLLAVSWVSVEIYYDCKTGYEEVKFERKLDGMKNQNVPEIFPEVYP